MKKVKHEIISDKHSDFLTLLNTFYKHIKIAGQQVYDVKLNMKMYNKDYSGHVPRYVAIFRTVPQEGGAE